MVDNTGEPSGLRVKWSKRLSDSHKRFEKNLHQSGDRVIDQYRIEKREATNGRIQQDKYNILYSNTETIKPSLYAQTPKVQVQKRDTDSSDPVALGATMLLEKAIEYQIGIQDGGFDTLVWGAVEDYILPGMANVWMRYVPTLAGDEVVYEKVAMDYVFWKDFRCSRGRTWNEVWWVARCAYMDKAAVTERFGEEKAQKISYNQSNKERNNNNESLEEDQAAVWEIWDKRAKKAIWFCEDLSDDVLDAKDDPLKLEGFFPCPRPLRAITTNNTIMPRPFYAQYQAQADELNELTHRIRRLTKGLRLVGVYDASEPNLKNLLTGEDNKMVPVENYSMFTEKGGLNATIQFLPITDVVNSLMQLYQARTEVKNEIYEITGWSDIIRGVSKASETLGAQQLKSDWAGSRIKMMQREIQRFIRDILRITGEIVAEHFSRTTMALITGLAADLIRMPGPKQAEVTHTFDQALSLLKDDKQRCALIDIETDSTLLPDEANDKKERMEFVGAVGAFLQQSVPAMTTYPPIAPLLASILDFAVKGFRAGRPLQEQISTFTDAIKSGTMPPPTDPKAKQGGDNGAAKAQTDMQIAQMEDARKKEEAQAQVAKDQADMALKQQMEHNRHDEAMLSLEVKKAEIALREGELELKRTELGLQRAKIEHDANMDIAGHEHEVQAHQDDLLDKDNERAFQASQSEEERAANSGLDAAL